MAQKDKSKTDSDAREDDAGDEIGLDDFAGSIRAGRAPRVTGEHGRDAIAVAERILLQIATHAWDGAAEGPVGPQVVPMSPTIPAPHWKLGAKLPAAPNEPRKAG